ncbi:MAG: hypothetical protein WKF59_26325 [Chitinophagaceae bacterium]
MGRIRTLVSGSQNGADMERCRAGAENYGTGICGAEAGRYTDLPWEYFAPVRQE